MLTYNLFDSGKREHGVKEANAQLQAADLAAQLTKAKAAQAVRSSYLDLERSREFYQLARRMVLPAGIVKASYVSGDAGMDPSQAKLEAELFRAELEYRQAYAQVKSLVGGH
jgi:outer membrane protein TolC